MPAPDEGISNGMEQLIYRIVSESKDKAPGYEDIVSGSLKRLLFHLQSPIEYTHSYVRLKAIREQNLFEDTVTYINLQKRKVSRSELADALNYNGDYISQIFYKQTGQTLADYIRNVCLREDVYKRQRQACLCNRGIFDKVNYAILAEDYFGRQKMEKDD